MGTIEKAGAGQAGSGRVKKLERAPSPILLVFFLQDPARPRPLFRSSPLTESLEQAMSSSERITFY